MTSKISRNYLPEFFALGFRRSRPSMVTVNLTNRCNQRCIYCELGKVPQLPGKDALTLEDLFWIIDQMQDQKISKISLCGGEPFLFEGIFKVVAYAGSKNVRCSITSNGMIIHQFSVDELSILKKCNTEINISIDSFIEEINNQTRGNPLALGNALKSMERLTEMGIPVTVLTAISKFNYSGLSTFFENAYHKGIKQVLFQPIIYFSNYPDMQPIMQKSGINVGVDQLDILMMELKKILNFERHHKINTNVYRFYPWIRHYLETAVYNDGRWFFNAVLKKFYCREIDAIIDISYDGGIQPCGLALASVNIRDNRQRGLMALWSEATEALRHDMHQGKYHDFCNGCCHHFSRNMLASMLKYPMKNRRALFSFLPLIFSRILSRLLKKVYL